MHTQIEVDKIYTLVTHTVPICYLLLPLSALWEISENIK